MSTDLIEAPTAAAPSALAMIVMDPAKYVAELYAPFRAKFSAAKTAADAIAIDCSTPAGNAVAVKHRAVFRDEIRLALESVRVERKAPILEIGRLIDCYAKQIATEVAPYEAKFDAAIKAEAARKEAIKALEQARKDKIRADIDGFRDIPAKLAGKSVADLEFALRDMDNIEVHRSRFAEFTADAVKVIAGVTKAIEGMLTAAIQSEAATAAAEQARLAEVARIAAEREEMAIQRAENQRIAAEQAATAKKLADQQTAIELVARQQREQAAEAERLAQAKRERVADAVKAELDAQQAQIAAARQALADERAAADQHTTATAAQAQADAARDEAEAMDLQFDIDVAAGAAQVELLAESAPAPTAITSVPPELADAADQMRLDLDFLFGLAFHSNLDMVEMIGHLERIDFAAARTLMSCYALAWGIEQDDAAKARDAVNMKAYNGSRATPIDHDLSDTEGGSCD